jgi:hypothetical protein
VGLDYSNRRDRKPVRPIDTRSGDTLLPVTIEAGDPIVIFNVIKPAAIIKNSFRIFP